METAEETRKAREAATGAPDEQGAWASRAFATTSSVRTFLLLAAALLAACAVGTFIPQGQPPAALEERFGPWLGRVLGTAGAGDLFRSWWFNGLLAALGFNLAACSLRRIRAARRRPGVFLVHAALLLILAGALVRGLSSERGLLQLKEGAWADSFEIGPRRHGFLPFRVRLDRFVVDHWEGAAHYLQVRVPILGIDSVVRAKVGERLRLGDDAELEALRFLPNFVLGPRGPDTRDQDPANPALELAYRRGGGERRLWTFARFPDMHQDMGGEARILYQFVPSRVRQFRSQVTLLRDEVEVKRGSLHVNQPLSHAGWTLYQFGFDRSDPTRSTLLVVRDPGVPLVYAGFAVLVAGLALNLRWGRFRP